MRGYEADNLDYVSPHEGLPAGHLDLGDTQFRGDLDYSPDLGGGHLLPRVVLPLAVAEEACEVTPLGDAYAEARYAPPEGVDEGFQTDTRLNTSLTRPKMVMHAHA